MNRREFFSLVAGILLIVACTPQPQAATPVFIPVIVTVGIPIPVTVTPTPVPAQPISTDTASTTQTVNLPNLEEDSQAWAVYEEGSPVWTMQNVDSPARQGKALQCSLTGGSPNSNAHCYINIPPVAEANSFKLSLDFQFAPATTYNNETEPSIVQAIEFTMNKWENSKRYEFAVQWQNVGEGAPQWRYWDASRSGDQRWVPINSNANYRLDGEAWHTLVLEGDIAGDQIHYKNFTIDNFTYTLDLLVPYVSAPDDDKLAVAVQVDGNATQSPYDLFIDNVDFAVQKHVNCSEVDSSGKAAFDFAYVDTFITTQGSTGFVINQDTKITWEPTCLMDLQYYYLGDVIFEKKDAGSGQYDLSGEIPSGEEIELKIWRAGEIINSAWVRVRE